jgi:hypothetical protein
MKQIEKVRNVFGDNHIEWEEGMESGWGENSLIINGVDSKILVYVLDEKGKLRLSYYDLFVKGEYSPIFDSKIEETTTSFRGTRKSISSMLKDLDLV